MPGGPSVTAPLGLAIFAAIKLAGYSSFAVYLNNLFPDNWRNIFYVGFCRTALGLGFGTALALFGFIAIAFAGPAGVVLYLAVLIPVRGLEWWIIISEMYKVKWDDRNRNKALILGIVTSFLLDIPAIYGFFTVDPFWIC